MLGLWNEQGNQFEGLGKKYEGRNGALDIMHLRFTTVHDALNIAENSPTIIGAMARIQKLNEISDALAEKQKIKQEQQKYEADLEAAFDMSSTESQYNPATPAPEATVALPTEYVHNREQAIADAQALASLAHDRKADTHEQNLAT